MLILTCPNCGLSVDETDLAPGGEAHLTRAGTASSDSAFESYLFHRQNPRGVHFERWRHIYGCGKWFHAARCTMTLEVFGTYSAQTTAPPEAILQAIRARRPDWRPSSGPATPTAKSKAATAKAKAAVKTPAKTQTIAKPETGGAAS